MEVPESLPSSNRTPLWVPPRLQEKIIFHMVRTAAAQPGPMILLAHGLPGEGKTFSITSILQKLDVAVFSIDAGQFESAEAGAPVCLLRKKYLSAAATALGKAANQGRRGRPRAAALVIEDVDLVLGHWNLTQYTVNTQLLLAFLMLLCDDPGRAFGGRTPRIPIYMTANDPTVLHGPLIRSGRAEVLPWELSLDERRQMVGRIFDHLKESDLERLVDWFPSEPVAFYADLKRRWNDELSRQEIASTTPREALRLALQGQWRIAGNPPSLPDLLALGRKAEESRRGVCKEERDDEK